MKLIRLRCPNCGADFENVNVSENQKVFTCTRLGCGASFILDQGIKFADIKQAEAEKIQHYRTEMSDALVPFDRSLAEQNAEHILSIIPDDFRAKAVLAITKCSFEDKRPLEIFLTSKPECTPEEFEEAYHLLLIHSNHKIWKILTKILPEYVHEPQKLKDMQMLAENRLNEILREIDFFALVPRDIFICHSSVDNELVMRVLSELEADGNKCWISERNMPPDTLYYWEKIDEAIRLCKIFLVCCSENAMLSDPVQKELTLAAKTPAKRLELKLDDRRHTTQFAHFFDGITWIKLTDDFDASMNKLKECVYLLKYAETAQEEDKRLTEQEFNLRLEEEKQRWLSVEKPLWLEREKLLWLEKEKPVWLEREKRLWLEKEKPLWLEREKRVWLNEMGKKDRNKTQDTIKNNNSKTIPELKAGQFYTIGRYRQNISSQAGVDPIEWQVLAVEKDRALLISRFLLDAKPYHEKNENVVWKDCTLRNWLNNDFFRYAFSAEEKEKITSEIFILSIDELDRYTSSDPSKRQCKVTEYAKSKGAFYSNRNLSWWWLREDNFPGRLAGAIDVYGNYKQNFCRVDNIAGTVRPAFWISLPNLPGWD